MRPRTRVVAAVLAAGLLAGSAGAAAAPWGGATARAADPTPSPAAIDPDAPPGEPLIPYITALLVASGVLAATGFALMRARRERAPDVRRRRLASVWTCGACGQPNAGDRESCFACAAARGPAPS